MANPDDFTAGFTTRAQAQNEVSPKLHREASREALSAKATRLVA